MILHANKDHSFTSLIMEKPWTAEDLFGEKTPGF